MSSTFAFAEPPKSVVSTPLRIDAPGSYRVFADFASKGRTTTLAGDLRVDGRANLHPLPAPRPFAVSDGGYDVRLQASSARPGAEAQLRFAISKDGVPVKTEPYLGAGGHLVALREGDLAFLHVHPIDDDLVSRPGPRIVDGLEAAAKLIHPELFQ